MTDRTAAREDAPGLRGEIRSLVGGVNLAVLIAATGAGVWGVFDSMTDAGGDRFAGNLVVAAPGIYAGWCMLEIAWKRLASVGAVLLRMVAACFVAPAFVALPVAVVQAIAVAFPGVRQVITDAQAQNGGFHYFWDEGFATQLLLVPLGGYVIGMCIPLGVVLILVLPIVSIRAPQIAGQGSHLQKLEGGKRDSTTALVFCGLGAIVLGIVLWVFGGGDAISDFPEDLGRLVQGLIRYGSFSWGDATWLFGVMLVAVGIVVAGWGCVRVLSARSRAAGA